jgi:hypothetical protein
MTSWPYDPELPRGFQEADLEQAALERAGAEASRDRQRARALFVAGLLPEAADACPHGWGYGTHGTAAQAAGDPHAGEAGFRCHHCGSYWTEDWTVDHRDYIPAEACSFRPFEEVTP